MYVRLFLVPFRPLRKEYTGRENDGNGLYYYRARYYSPLLGRFISQDPLGFAGSGPNLYAYVFDSPTNLVDPLGLQSGTATDTLAEEVAKYIARLEAQLAAEAVPATTPELGAGFAAEVETGVAGGPIGVAVLGLAAAGTTAYYGWQAAVAIHHENAAYDESNEAIHKLNQVLLHHPLKLPNLAGRSCSKKADVDACTKRASEETFWCAASFKDWSPELYQMCVARAQERLTACLDGLPDPGPLNPLDPDWSID